MKVIDYAWINLWPIVCLSLFFCAVLLGVVLLMNSPASEKGRSIILGPGDYNRTIMSGGMERFYNVHVPASYVSSTPTPVVLNFHGGGGNSETQRTISRMNQASERYGFIVVYPQGTGPKWRLINPHGYTWNAGNCGVWAVKHGIDDVGYTRDLLNDLERQVNVDKNRVFATGISNGAMMCFRLACELSDRIAAIAPISGTMAVTVTGCAPSRPVSVIYFHGTADKFAPFAGGRGRWFLGQRNIIYQSVDQTIAFWRQQDGITGPPREVRRGEATGYYYGPGANGSEVALWVIKGGGHTWPGGQFGVLGEKVLGRITHAISANDLMWEFFQKHPMR
jgi:polyhydroxybutyrate depolymerase